uniref:Uncharacterized protein LOC108051330 isoform X2 n=1 Tax=Drosophila rhopaloa TaxID=1041015 RepID=A0A6P4FG37_DRORH
MGIPTIKKCCCCELKWGALIASIVDLILVAAVAFDCKHFASSGSAMEIVWIVILVIHIAHIVGCILVMVSICKPNKNLVICYLITGIIRFILDIIVLIYFIIKTEFEYVITICLILAGIGLAVYFWIIIYSWYKKLGGSTPVD